MFSPLSLAGIWTPGFWEIFILFLVVLIIFGPKSIPSLGRSLGRGMREFRDASSKLSDAMEEAVEEDEKQKSSAPERIEGKPQAPAEAVSTSPRGAGIEEKSRAGGPG